MRINQYLVCGKPNAFAHHLVVVFKRNDHDSCVFRVHIPVGIYGCRLEEVILFALR